MSELSQRLRSLDVFRGLTIAGMIVVNDPGSWAYVYPPLRHADWHGITPTDFVFPFFLFIVGVSIVLAYSKRLKSDVSHAPLIGKIFKRSGIIFGLGLLLWLIPNFDFGGLRIPGVLQRIALVFLSCSILFLKTTWRTQLYLMMGLLLGYWAMLSLIPVPIDEVIAAALQSGEVPSQAGPLAIGSLSKISDGFIAANLEPGANLEAWLDRAVIPGRLWQYSWDPEGLLSTLPSIGSGLSGMMVGHILLSRKKSIDKVVFLFIAGFLAFAIGNVWGWFFPLNKNLWSSSFVLYTSGLATMTLAALYWWIDVEEKGTHNRFFFFCQVFGANAITAYVLHGLFARFYGGVTSFWMETGMGLGLSGEFASLLFALSYTMFIYLFAWILWKRKIFIKV
ncbi:MAG: heparan-alpha-glucosaminide N-acetyltransferase domain-containing protein [Bacteroidota bacterium]